MSFRTYAPAVNGRAIFGLGENGSLGWFVEAARTDTNAGPMASYRNFTRLAAAQAEARRLGPANAGSDAAAT
jgi:hypothetical protein